MDQNLCSKVPLRVGFMWNARICASNNVCVCLTEINVHYTTVKGMCVCVCVCVCVCECVCVRAYVWLEERRGEERRGGVVVRDRGEEKRLRGTLEWMHGVSESDSN